MAHFGKRSAFQGQASSFTSREYAKLAPIELGHLNPLGSRNVDRKWIAHVRHAEAHRSAPTFRDDPVDARAGRPGECRRFGDGSIRFGRPISRHQYARRRSFRGLTPLGPERPTKGIALVA